MPWTAPSLLAPTRGCLSRVTAATRFNPGVRASIRRPWLPSRFRPALGRITWSTRSAWAAPSGSATILARDDPLLGGLTAGPLSQAEVLVDLVLVAVDRARLDLFERHRSARVIRLEQGIDQRHSGSGYLARDLRLGPASNARREFVVLQRQQLAVGARKIEIVPPDPLAPEQRCCHGLQAVAGGVIQDLLADHLGRIVQEESNWPSIPVARRNDRAAGAIDQALLEWLTVAGVVLYPLAKRAIRERDLPEHGIFARWLD